METPPMSHRLFTLDEVSLDRPLTTTTASLEVLFGWRTAPPEKLIERIEGQYRWVDRHDDAGWLAVGLLFVAAIVLASSDVVSGRGTAVVWLVWALVAVGWLCAHSTPLATAPIAYVGLWSHLPAPTPRNAREDAGQRVVGFVLMVSATAVITMAGLWREIQLEALNGVDVTGNPELAAAVLDARASSISTWMTTMVVVLAVAIAAVVSRWLHTVDRTLYDAGICAPGRRRRQPTRLQYSLAVTVIGMLAVALMAVLGS